MQHDAIAVLKGWEALIMTICIVEASREEKIPDHRDDPVIPIWLCAYRESSEWVGLVEI